MLVENLIEHNNGTVEAFYEQRQTELFITNRDHDIGNSMDLFRVPFGPYIDKLIDTARGVDTTRFNGMLKDWIGRSTGWRVRRSLLRRTIGFHAG